MKNDIILPTKQLRPAPRLTVEPRSSRRVVGFDVLRTPAHSVVQRDAHKPKGLLLKVPAQMMSDTKSPVPSTQMNSTNDVPYFRISAKQVIKSEDLPTPSGVSYVSPFKKQKNVKLYLANGLVACIAVVGIVMMTQGYLLNQRVTSQVAALQSDVSDSSESDGLVTTSSSQIPTSKTPDDPNFIQNYRVAANLPRTITIDAIGVNARVLQAGVDEDNVMMTPATSYDTAWYNGSSQPGQMGAMIINGHLHGDTRLGIFGHLDTLKAGEEIVVQKGDGTDITYVVKKVETVKIEDVNMAALMVSYDTTRPGLNLITCGGEYDPVTNKIDSRTLVYAVQQN